MKRIMLMSGFLGSGKTTSMIALAKYLESQQKKVCLITNDLGENLVDTRYVINNNVPVLEISNGCLCHDVDQLIEKIDCHVKEYDPDLVAFEPVGACVNMVAQVYKDLAKRFPGKYVLAPVSAIVDPVRYQAIYMNSGENTFPVQTAYMFKKQLEEADLLVINKSDLLDKETLDHLQTHLQDTFPDIPNITISALNNKGIDTWAEYIMNNESNMLDLDIDMDYVMQGAANMGWYNEVCRVSGGDEIDYVKFSRQYVTMVRDKIVAENAEIAHLKIIVTKGDEYCKTALTTRNDEPNTVGSIVTKDEVTLNVNIRAILPAEKLKVLMKGCLNEILHLYNLQILDNVSQTFSSVESAPIPVKNG